MNTLNIDACAVINSLPKVNSSQLERLCQTPKKWKLAFQKYKHSNSFFKLQLQNCVFQTSIFKFYLLSPISALLLPTCSIVEKVQNYINNFWLILKKWVWRADFERFTKMRSFWQPKHVFHKTLKISAPNSFFQNEPKFFYLILDLFNKF